MDDARIIDLIQSKVTAENVDSGWMVALLLMRSIPIQTQIADHLKALETAIAEHDSAGTSLSERLSGISHQLRTNVRGKGQGSGRTRQRQSSRRW
jgi:hypothetical protein